MFKKIIGEAIFPLLLILFILMLGLAVESLGWLWLHVLGV